MDTGKLVEWSVEVGEYFEAGEMIC